MVFNDKLLSLRIMYSRLIHVLACSSTSLILLLDNNHLDILPFIYPFINWSTFGLFHFLAILNYAAMNIHLCLCVNISLGYMTRN